MKERVMSGQYSLRKEEESELYGLSQAQLEQKIRPLLRDLKALHLHEFSRRSRDIRLLNSLLWVYIQRAGVLTRVVTNIRLLWVLCGINSINIFARQLDMNPSFVGRLLSGEDTGLGGWNFPNLMRITGLLKVDSEVWLISDLAESVRRAALQKEGK